jgi:hypothetical protein
MNEHEQEIRLQWEGRDVTRICIDFAFTLDLWRLEDGDAGVRIEAPFLLRTAAGEQEFDPEGPRDRLAAAFTLFQKTVERAVCSQQGTLEIVFTHGITLYQAGSDDGHEAWEAHGPGDLDLISLGNRSLMHRKGHHPASHAGGIVEDTA